MPNPLATALIKSAKPTKSRKAKTKKDFAQSIIGNKGGRAVFAFTEIKNAKPIPGVVGEGRLKALKKAVINRNARMRRQVKALSGEYTAKNALALIRGQYLPPVVRISFDKIKSVKDYNALMRMLEADKSKEWKGTRLEAMRQWLRKSVARSIWIDEDDDPELFTRISQMSEREIMAFRRDYKGLIGDIFDYYVDEDVIDADDRDVMWTRIRQAVGLTGRPGMQPIISL